MINENNISINSSYSFFECRPVGIPTFYKNKIISQLKNSTYFNLTKKEFLNVTHGCISFDNIHVQNTKDIMHIKLTNSQRKQLLKHFDLKTKSR